jgi:hypothetical protein
MPDKIVLQKYYGDVIQVDGKCWQFAGVDDIVHTHTSGDVSALFASCDDCLSGNNPLIVPPSGLSQSLGDVHYVYGDPDTIALDPTMASFNVDDNSSDNEIVWWTHTEGGVEYVIKYTQQEFTYTAGGRSIDQVVVSASDGSVDDTYTLNSPTQDSTLRNGGAWTNGGVSGLGTAISYNITERIIENADCSEALGVSSHFGLFNLEVSPNSGFMIMDENGGALWYVWKQLATAYGTGAVNNPSSAGFDGIGTFLSGINGYNARSQFEATPSSVRETFDNPTASAIIDKLKELSAIDGSWNADWDPLAQTPINCPPVDFARVLQTTSGLNNWAALEPLIEAGTFFESSVGFRTEFGYNSGPNLTTADMSRKVIPANTVSLDIDYNSYKRGSHDTTTYLFVISNTEPFTGADIRNMTDTGVSMSPTNTDFNTVFNLDISAVLNVVDNSKDMFLVLIPDYYYNDEDTANWVDASSDGASNFVKILAYNY